MKGCLSGCLRKVGLAALAVGFAYAGWKWGPAVFPRVEAWLGAGTGEVAEVPVEREPTPAIAEATLDRVEAFRAGTGGDRLELDAVELSSVLRHTLPGIIPPGIARPTVDLDGESVWLTARVETAAIPNLPAFDEIVGLLPDTVDMRLRGSVLPFGEGWAALQVERVEAERIPLPSRMIPGILEALGRRPREGLPERALAVPLPSGLERVYVEGGRMVLLADR